MSPSRLESSLEHVLGRPCANSKMSYRQDRAAADRGGEGGLQVPAAQAAAATSSAGRKARRHTAARLASSPLDWQLNVPGHSSWLGAIGERGLDGDAIERLARLRRILPLLAEELARVRRDAAALRVENRRLLDRLRDLEQDLAADADGKRMVARRLGAREWRRG